MSDEVDWDDKDEVLEAVSKKGTDLKNADEDLQDDSEVGTTSSGSE